MLIELFSLCRDLRDLQDKRYSINNNTVEVIIPSGAKLHAESEWNLLLHTAVNQLV